MSLAMSAFDPKRTSRSHSAEKPTETGSRTRAGTGRFLQMLEASSLQVKCTKCTPKCLLPSLAMSIQAADLLLDVLLDFLSRG